MRANGTGILYGKEAWLNKLPPYQGGGEMIKEVTFEKTTYADLPHKFEAGTPNIAGGIVLGTAIDYMNEIGFENIQKQDWNYWSTPQNDYWKSRFKNLWYFQGKNFSGFV